MPKKIFLFAATAWTLLMLYVCLIKSSNVPKISLPYLDKIVHATLHFVFTLFWFFYLKNTIKSTTVSKLLCFCILLSFLFGISIELLQKYATTTRSADILDVLANSIGAVLAGFFVSYLSKRKLLGKL